MGHKENIPDNQPFDGLINNPVEQANDQIDNLENLSLAEIQEKMKFFRNEIKRGETRDSLNRYNEELVISSENELRKLEVLKQQLEQTDKPKKKKIIITKPETLEKPVDDLTIKIAEADKKIKEYKKEIKIAEKPDNFGKYHDDKVAEAENNYHSWELDFRDSTKTRLHY